MKHPSLYRFLLMLACMVVSAYSYFALAALKADRSYFALLGVAGLLLALPLVRRIQSGYAKEVWLPSLIGLASAVVAFDAGSRWAAEHSILQLPQFAHYALHWGFVIVYVWVAAALALANLWLLFALPYWWRNGHASGFVSFGDLAQTHAQARALAFFRTGRAAVLGSALALPFGLISGLAMALLPAWLFLIPHLGDALRLALGAAAGIVLGRRHVNAANQRRNWNAYARPSSRRAAAAASGVSTLSAQRPSGASRTAPARAKARRKERSPAA
jgi:hypothetical protein